MLVLGTVASLMLAGCSSTPSKVDTGPIHARTFNFVTPPSKPFPDYADNREQVNKMIQASIIRDLAAHGLSQVPQGGDITVAYMVIIGNNASTTAISDYFGYRDDTAALQEKAFEAYNKSKNPNYFTAGTLVIDLIDTRSFKLLRRGYATRPIMANPTAEMRANRIQEVVDEILQGVNISP